MDAAALAQTFYGPRDVPVSPAISPPTASGVDLWQSSLLASPTDVARCEELLDADERARAQQFSQTLARTRFVVGRAGLRTLLGRYLKIDPRAVRLAYGKKGKPYLDPLYTTDLRFNVSHADDFVLYAIAREREVGVDIERLRVDLPVMGIAERFFAPREIAALRALGPDARVQAFFVCWTRKEAYLKARGVGLGLGLDRFIVGIAATGRNTLFNGKPDRQGHRWSIESLELPPGYVGALVAQGTDWTLQRHA